MLPGKLPPFGSVLLGFAQLRLLNESLISESRAVHCGWGDSLHSDSVLSAAFILLRIRRNRQF
jgi:hypothetical protein